MENINMKIIFSIILISIGILSLIWSVMWCEWIYPRNYEANLKLADDASLPQAKADYLQAYLDKVSDIQGKPRWIFTRPDLNLELQKEIMKGLIERFDAVAKISPSEMAYQQGMYQLTGQEIDHQLDRISDIFQSAKLRENPLNALFMWYGWILSLIGFSVLFLT